MKKVTIKKEIKEPRIKNRTLLIIVWICCLISWILPMPYKIIPLTIEMICAFIIIFKANKISDKTIVIKAYNVYGGGACPTQFYWNDKKYYYYFRLRNGKYKLYKGKTDPDKDIEFFKKSKIIAEGEYGDNIEGYITFDEMKLLLMFNDIFLEIHGKPNINKLI